MQEMNQKFCQCCGMPLGEGTDMQGTNADGSKNGDYCKYCLDKGAFSACSSVMPGLAAAILGAQKAAISSMVQSWRNCPPS